MHGTGNTGFAQCDAYHRRRWNLQDVTSLSPARRAASGRHWPNGFKPTGARVVPSDREPHGVARLVEELNAERADSAVAFPVDVGTESGNRSLVEASEA